MAAQTMEICTTCNRILALGKSGDLFLGPSFSQMFYQGMEWSLAVTIARNMLPHHND